MTLKGTVLVFGDAATHALAIAAGAVGLAYLLSAALFYGSWLVVEVTAFLFGWLLLGYATASLWPSSPWLLDGGERRLWLPGRDREEDNGAKSGTAVEEHALGRAILAFPPFRDLDQSDRVSSRIRLFAGGVLTLLVSYGIEVWLVAN